MSWLDNFTQATVIMCLGMSIVFLFVASLVVLIQVSARVFSKHIEAPPVAAPAASSGSAMVAAIAAAIKQYSSDQNKPVIRG